MHAVVPWVLNVLSVLCWGLTRPDSCSWGSAVALVAHSLSCVCPVHLFVTQFVKDAQMPLRPVADTATPVPWMLEQGR